MEFCLSQGSAGPEIGMLIENLRVLGFNIEPGTDFTPQVAAALKMFQQSSHDHLGNPLKIDGRLGASTALALDNARGRARKSSCFDESDLPPMPDGGSTFARRAALIALAEYMRASGEQGGDNAGPDIARYKTTTQRGTAWSVDFATYCYREAYAPNWSPFGTSHDTQSLIEAAQAKGWLLPNVYSSLLPGDLIIWHFLEPGLATQGNWRGQVGVVWSCEDGNIITLEGDRGPYPSLVRPYHHKIKNLVRAATDGQLRDCITIIRVN
jgi:hypothetical protein